MKKTTTLLSVRTLFLIVLMFIVSHAHALDITWDDETKTMTFSSTTSEAVNSANVQASAGYGDYSIHIQETECVVFDGNISDLQTAVFNRSDLHEEGITKLVVNSAALANKNYTESFNLRVVFPKAVTIEFGEDVKRIGDNFFNYKYNDDEYRLKVSSVQHLIFKGEIEEIGKYAFATAGFETIFIPKTLKIVRQGAFSNCRVAKHIVFEEDSQLEIVENAGFAYLWAIEDEEISLPASLKSLHSYAFRETGFRPAQWNIVGGKLEPIRTGCPKTIYVNCQNVAYPQPAYVYSGANDSNGGTGSFQYMFPNMETIVFSEDVTKIGDCLFRMHQNDFPNFEPKLKNVIFKGGIDNVTYIGTNAYNCTPLEEIHIPKDLTTVSNYAFANSKGNGVDPVKIFFDGDKVKYINTNAFAYCTFTSIEIPSSVESIGTYAFSQCTNLEEIIMNAVTPPTLQHTNAFNGARKFVLRVPDGSVEAYRNAPVWNQLGAICEIRAMNCIELMDGDTYDRNDYPEGVKTEVIYTRDFDVKVGRKNWHSIYLPFTLKYDEWVNVGSMYKIKNVREYDNDNNGAIDAWAVEVRKLGPGTSTKANTPYLFIPFMSGEQKFDALYTSLASSDPIDDEDSKNWCASTDFVFTFNGNYEMWKPFELDKYFAVTASGVLKYANKVSNATLNSYRWYMGIYDKETEQLVKPSEFYPGVSATPQSIYIIDEDDLDDVTFISGIINYTNEEDAAACYDVLGRKVSEQSMKKGSIYVRGGKKIVCQ